MIYQVTDWLLTASERVPEMYFQLPVAGAEDWEYRERVYCYELYHQWRSLWDDDSEFSLSGEIDKNGHPLIRTPAKPDFLVHRPGVMDNLLIVEVKPCNAPIQRVRDDIEKLLYFRLREPQYRNAYLWIYGLSGVEWPDYREKLQIEEWGDGAVEENIDCMLHEWPGARGHLVAW